jgi:hypothetical protein
MNSVAIIQSNYLPWKGYFDIINDVDTFIFLEDVQYTKGDWRNRNKIKTPYGIKWLTVPVHGSIRQTISNTKIDNSRKWAEDHKKRIHHNYARSNYYNSYKDDIFKIYSQDFATISDLNIYSIRMICKLFDLQVEFRNSEDLEAQGSKDDKIIEICKMIGAKKYISGPSAKFYININKFKEAGIEVEYKDYSGYPEYDQLWNNFNHFVSVIDTIFNCGDKTPYYIWGWRNDLKY